jgi:HPt (histidine-containing phosphotransfer) domain-containing protein
MTADPLAALRVRFRARGMEDADRLEQALESGERVELERLVHGLAGSAGMFGYRRIGRIAGEVDAAFARNEPDAVRSIPELIAAIRSELAPDHS